VLQLFLDTSMCRVLLHLVLSLECLPVLLGCCHLLKHLVSQRLPFTLLSHHHTAAVVCCVSLYDLQADHQWLLQGDTRLHPISTCWRVLQEQQHTHVQCTWDTCVVYIRPLFGTQPQMILRRESVGGHERLEGCLL
jgi:hypothetical protein